jgi:hypothetical protein
MPSHYKQHKVPASMPPYNPQQHPRSTCLGKGVNLALYSAPRAPPRLAHLSESIYEKYFSDGLFVEKNLEGLK